MKVLVDTCVWSLALRKKKVAHDPFVMELHELINELRVQMIGPIRQEILSAIRSESQFSTIKGGHFISALLKVNSTFTNLIYWQGFLQFPSI